MKFEFQLVLTEKCNLRCTYCYMKDKPRTMTKEVFNAHLKMLPKFMEIFNCKTYATVFFGGEPLLNWELVEYITPILEKDPKCDRIIAITNGIPLDDYKLDYISRSKKAHISLSFDGLWNKTNRPLATGESSFELYQKEPLYSFIRKGMGGTKVMVSPSSIDTLVENYKWFVEEMGSPFPDYSIVRDDIWSEDDIRRFEIECKNLADQTIEYIRSGIRTLPGFFKLYILDLVVNEAYGKRDFCCYVGHSGAGFMPNGEIYPCARYGSNEEFILANSMTQEVFEENLKIIKNPLLINLTAYEKCKECTLRKYCNAGCTYSQMINSSDGKTGEPLDSICKLFHITYREAIRITKELKGNKVFKHIVEHSIRNIG